MCDYTISKRPMTDKLYCITKIHLLQSLWIALLLAKLAKDLSATYRQQGCVRSDPEPDEKGDHEISNELIEGNTEILIQIFPKETPSHLRSNVRLIESFARRLEKEAKVCNTYLFT